jgi:hypothetical protein
MPCAIDKGCAVAPPREHRCLMTTEENGGPIEREPVTFEG